MRGQTLASPRCLGLRRVRVAYPTEEAFNHLRQICEMALPPCRVGAPRRSRPASGAIVLRHMQGDADLAQRCDMGLDVIGLVRSDLRSIDREMFVRQHGLDFGKIPPSCVPFSLFTSAMIGAVCSAEASENPVALVDVQFRYYSATYLASLIVRMAAEAVSSSEMPMVVTSSLS
jgi:hypothetical protein